MKTAALAWALWAVSTAVFAQGIEPVGIQVDTSGNHVLEPGENANLVPSWRNTGGINLIVTGTLGDFTGPAGPTYTIAVGQADYGVIPAGQVGTCFQCYLLSVTGARPLLHWDARATETVRGGISNTWTLHVGNSFADVAAGSPFYRFVETLLHRGVTGGCSGTEYCPSGSTARDQMAVFALVAKEGAGYAPPACGTPVFNDIPASSPFCPFVEELARRGAVTGCGGGNYCPGSPVAREQMAVIVLRTLDPALNPPACGTPMFADVPASSPFCRWIEELARRGVVSGCGGGNYCPAQPVTREQMAVFITGTFALTLYGV
jgi:S-layer family protein